MRTLGWEKGVGPGGQTLGATDQGAEPAATSAATSCHAGSADSHLGAKIHGAETCYLGAARHGAELRVHFLNSFQQGSNCEILSQKGPKNKKVGITGPTESTYVSLYVVELKSRKTGKI
jgi:hypothetical protein